MSSRIQDQPIVSRMGQRARRWLVSIGLVSLALVCGLSSAATISYVYDNLGRLRAVIDPASNTAIYSYDAVGNLTGITRQPSTTKTILQFTPSSGPVGTPVTIYGTGFSATPASNTVKFNGTTATVATASTTVLTTTVPAGATTGTISVTVAGTTVTSVTSFTVGTGAAPTLSSFSPAVAGAGETVTLTGTNYDTTLINDRVAFTAAIGAVATATATTTTITVPVPASAQTGKLSVSTVQGQTTSALEFFVVPPGVVATDIQYTGRITVNGSTVAASITTANKNGLMVFDGIAGQRLDIGFSSVTITYVYVTVYRPDGVALTIPVVHNTSGGSIELPILPMTGTYTIFLDPYASYTGTVTVTLSTELTGTITPGGAAVPISLTRVGQNARLAFSGTAGQSVSLGITANTIVGSTIALLNPDGTALVTKNGVNGSDAIDTQILPVTGTYAVFVDPQDANTGSMTLTLYNQPDLSGSITIDGASVPVTLTVPGQRARYTFTGTAGQQVNLGLSAVTLTQVTVLLLKPDSTAWAVATVGTTGGSLDPMALPVTGTYTLLVDPSSVYTGTITLTLSTELTGTLTINAAPIAVDLSRPGRNARFTFAGTAAQQITGQITNNTIPPTTSAVELNPDGSTLAFVWVSGATVTFPTQTLATTGTYSLVINPLGSNSGSLNLQITSP